MGQPLPPLTLLSDLLSSAVKYSAPGQEVAPRVAREGDLALFEVADQGIGFPAQDLNRFFHVFYRGHNVGPVSGTGLGLVVVKRCCDLCEGNVSVLSQEG